MLETRWQGRIGEIGPERTGRLERIGQERTRVESLRGAKSQNPYWELRKKQSGARSESRAENARPAVAQARRARETAEVGCGGTRQQGQYGGT